MKIIQIASASVSVAFANGFNSRLYGLDTKGNVYFWGKKSDPPTHIDTGGGSGGTHSQTSKMGWIMMVDEINTKKI